MEDWIVRVTPGAYRLRYELPVTKFGPRKKAMLETKQECDCNKYANKHDDN